MVVAVRGKLPAQVAMLLDLSDSPVSGSLEVSGDGDAILVARSGGSGELARFRQ